jgi:hypothetical protein
VATEVLRSTPSQRPSRLLKATVQPVAYCGPRCQVRRDSTVFPVLNDGIAAQCGPFGVELGSALHFGLHDYATVYTTSRLRFPFPSLPRCDAWKELQWTS